MKRLFFLLPVLFFIKASAQVPYYDFKKFRENDLSNDPLKKHSGKITWPDPNGTFILPLDRGMSMDTLQTIMEKINEKQRLGTLAYTQPNGTRVYITK